MWSSSKVGHTKWYLWPLVCHMVTFDLYVILIQISPYKYHSAGYHVKERKYYQEKRTQRNQYKLCKCQTEWPDWYYFFRNNFMKDSTLSRDSCNFKLRFIQWYLLCITCHLVGVNDSLGLTLSFNSGYDLFESCLKAMIFNAYCNILLCINDQTATRYYRKNTMTKLIKIIKKL